MASIQKNWDYIEKQLNFSKFG